MARTNSYRKAEVLEVLEADEGGNEVELESPVPFVDRKRGR